MKKLKNDELGRLTVSGYKSAHKIPVVLVLDNVRSLNNVGSVFRTSDAFRVAGIYLCGITGTPPHREIRKTALGATESVDWQYRDNTGDVLKELKGQGFKLLAVEQVDPSISLEDFLPDRETKYVFVFGNEIQGVSADLLSLVDGCIEIPQFGTKHSFNISISVGIILWHYFMKTRT
jgi:tRNA G18 (ribose-2'-O)-methylase SpoU